MMNKELLFSVTRKDFRVDTFRSGGKGGQNQNKIESGVRITHIESGAIGESREQRYQFQNKKIAFRRLLESDKWKIWYTEKVNSILYPEEFEGQNKETIRTYHFIRKVVKDNRTKKSYPIQEILDGDLDQITKDLLYDR